LGNVPLAAVMYFVNHQLANLARFYHADAMALERQAKQAYAILNGHPVSKLSVKGPHPAKLARAAARRFTTLQAGFERVCQEAGVDADGLIRGMPSGNLLLVLGDQVAARAGEPHEPTVNAQVGILRQFLGEVHDLDRPKEAPV
jgi:hypothetical protein